MRAIYFAISQIIHIFTVLLATKLLTFGLVLPAIAQITSDGTTNTIVNHNNNNFQIINGTEKGNNLFHSFSNFSVPTNSTATFDLTQTPNITTIFSRVTGGNVSQLDGLIQTLNSNNPVSLFLMNPNGIVFGKDARLNIGGSFIGTTANSVKFADSTEFSAVNANITPLLTMTVPIGLQMGTNPGNITVEGVGHALNRPFIFLPILGTANNMGLSVNSGQTLALIGGDISLNGGILTAADGHLELGSVKNAEIYLNASLKGWEFAYNTVQNFQDIHLSEQALVDASGLGGGSIQVQGNHLNIQDGSLVLLRNFGFLPSGNISINAASNLTITGTTSNGAVGSGIIGQVLGSAPGGTIFIQSNQALLSNGGVILNETYSPAMGGNLIIDIANTLTLSGISPLNPLAASGITSTTFADGKAGDLLISTRNLVANNGGIMATTTFGKGNGGDLTINATDSVFINIDIPGLALPSSIAAESIVAGNAGNLRINTARLTINGGGQILASTRGSGKAGEIFINAANSIEVSGTAPGAEQLLKSTISSNAQALPPEIQIFFGGLASPTGDSGNIEINTPILKINDNAAVTVGHLGTGNAGNLNIQAGQIYLDNQGQITAATESSGGGNIYLQTKDLLMLRNSSLINTEAKGTGNGGNITINSPIILGLENSDIIANAVQGRGGNIDITTQGIIGLEFRNTISPRVDITNDITASSQFNINGSVAINNIGIDPNSGLVELPASITDSSQQIARGCADASGSSFITTGRGGVPQNPAQELRSDRTWFDTRDISAFRNTQQVQAQNPQSPQPFVQATSWHRNAKGKIELVADKSSTPVPTVLTCATVAK
ncbi:filamentous hemagglutinin family outer membrane protein [Calothrix brevissima NIES-22]|nr:filamentous hemagglutinin family outer membrane protein [Calothrix brevissima NIES-22]